MSDGGDAKTDASRGQRPPEGGVGFDLVAAARRQAEAARKAIEAAEAARPGPPAEIPGYDIIDEIHRGGQGIVYKAIQRNTRRKVAIKVMLQGAFAGPRDRARFDREVQILAQIRDPHVVAIHDSGEASGHFYYVMDYIQGFALDAYLSKHELTVREKLGLFSKICRAVHAAHVRGIIHRDLKPSNIRVDADGDPHVLDFGLAKVAMGQMVGESPQVMTMTGQFVGSLPWASPEQAEGISERIDLRTDVYSLGVMLYQVLTGEFPYEVRGSMREVLEHIVNFEPRRPSAAAKGVDDEIDTITLKALSKDRDRRYQTAGELGRDVDRYLAGDMIEAKRDSATYVLRKALGRNRGLVAAASGFVLLVSAFAVTATILYGAAEREKRANARTSVLAERRADISRELMVELVDVVADAGGGPADGATARALAPMLAEWFARIDAQLPGDPEGRASMRTGLSRMLRSVGELTALEGQLRLAVDEAPEGTLTRRQAMAALADVLREQRRFDEAGGLTAAVLGYYTTHDPEEPVEALLLAQAHADAGQQAEKQADAARRSSGAGTSADAAALYADAMAHYDRAIAVLDEGALAGVGGIYEREGLVFRVLRGTAFVKAGQTAEGRAEIAAALARMSVIPATAHEVAVSTQRLANALHESGSVDEGIGKLAEAIDLFTRIQGPVGREVTGLTHTMYERTKLRRGAEDALPILRGLVGALDAHIPRGHDRYAMTAYYRGRLGEELIGIGRFEEGEAELLRATIDLITAHMGDGSVNRFRDELADRYRQTGRAAEADALLAEVASARAARDGARAP